MSKKPKLDPPSEEFADVLCDGGTPAAECEFCGVTHYVGSGHYMDEGELECLQQAAKAEPEKYQENNTSDAISFGYIDGRRFVWGCPCNSVRKYEDWINNHRTLILRYFERVRSANEIELNRLTEQLRASTRE
jgi:hypothetical protein